MHIKKIKTENPFFEVSDAIDRADLPFREVSPPENPKRWVKPHFSRFSDPNSGRISGEITISDSPLKGTGPENPSN